MPDDLERKLWDALVEALEELARAEAAASIAWQGGLGLGDLDYHGADRYTAERKAARAADLTPNERARLRAPAPL